MNLANDFQGEAERVLGFVQEIINALSIQNARDGCIMSRDELFYGQNFVPILMQVTNYLMFHSIKQAPKTCLKHWISLDTK